MKTYQKRALRTFAQAFLGTLSTQLVMYQGQELSRSIVISIVASALAGGVSAIMNLQEN